MNWNLPDASSTTARVVNGLLTLAALAALLLHGTGRAEPASAPALDLVLRPVAGAGGEVTAVDVTMTLDGATADPATPLARLPLVVSNVETIAASIASVGARDARGPLRLIAANEGSGAGEFRAWRPERATEGPVILSYRAPISGRVATRGAAPPLELRAEAGAFSGAGSTFLLRPAADTPVRLSVRWDLSALPGAAAAASSLGPGDVTLAAPQPPSRLERSFFMAGAIGRHPTAAGTGPFFAAWQGMPPFDAPALMAWTGQLHGRYLDFFRPPQVMPYGVFLRHNPVNAGGGVGLAGSFVATFGPATHPEDLKLTLAHEMFHTFAPSIGNPAGLESSWFGEGLAVFYARRLALRFGAIGPDAFLDDLNSHAGRLYTSLMASTPNREIPERFWADTRVRTLPYDRGSLYFATVDEAVRRASAGRRSLDELMLEMIARERTGRTLSNSDWEEVLAAELGVDAVAAFRNMLAGDMPVPASDAFGPCFRRTTRPLRRYELGFEPAVLTEPRRIVRGLVPGSAAAAAGLRDGDEIVRPVPQDAIQGDQMRHLQLEVNRDGRTFAIDYLPRGETVEAHQWERVAGVPDERCAL